MRVEIIPQGGFQTLDDNPSVCLPVEVSAAPFLGCDNGIRSQSGEEAQ